MFSAINRKVKRFVLRQQKKKPLVLISDTTLRDGVQMSGVRLRPEQKVRIAQALADAGIHSIDCGFPAAGDSEREGVRQIARQVKGPTLSALSRTTLADIDLAAEALAPVSPLKRAITLFIGTSPLHRAHKHEMGKPQIIDTACRAIEYAQKHFEIISFGPEDASRTEPDFLFEVYENAIQAGALSIGFTDTVGILTPDKAADMVKRIQDNVASMEDAMLGVHFHNDLGLATANSLACVRAGANIVQGTVNGIGERAGNVAIEEVVMALVLHEDEFKKKVTVNPHSLTSLCTCAAWLRSSPASSRRPTRR
jgi:2-isopropylmalate synthase